MTTKEQIECLSFSTYEMLAASNIHFNIIAQFHLANIRPGLLHLTYTFEDGVLCRSLKKVFNNLDTESQMYIKNKSDDNN